jgi:ectoine hydroxylase-related dioxygenase (phytanoyl-CoA dioxygenase family)
MVDPGTVEAFARDGAVVVRGVLTAAEVSDVRAGIDRVLAEPGPLALVASDPADPGAFVEDFCRWDQVPEYGRVIRESALADVAGELMGSRSVRLFHDHTLVKEPGTRQPTPWHQDQPYYNVTGRQNVSVWAPVDPVDEPSTLRFVAGSHRGPWLMPRTFRDAQARWFPEGTLAELPDVDADPDAYPVLAWALEPGDAVFFHMLTLHSAGGHPGPGRRRAFSVRFLGDDARHAPRPWRTSPEFPGLAEVLPAGAPMDHPLFPLLRTEDSAERDH